MNTERYQIEAREGWREAASSAPYLSFPRGWGVAIIPPLGGALMRFRVRKGGAEVSVYADYHEALGYFGEPHWEIYPDARGDNARFAIADINTLLAEIGKSLAAQNRSARKVPA